MEQFHAEYGVTRQKHFAQGPPNEERLLREARGTQAGSMRAQMESRPAAASLRRQRQQVADLELPEHGQATGEVQLALGSRQGHSMVAASARHDVQRWRHRGSLHTLLEHAYVQAASLGRYRQPSMQPSLLEECQRACEHTWLLQE